MSITNVNQKLIDYLIEHGDFVLGQELSHHFKVSTKTIYRRIKQIREELGEEIVESDRTKGYKLNLKKYISVVNSIYANDEMALSVEGRRLSILYHLLISAPKPYTISKFSSQFFVSQSSIVNDLEAIEERLQGSHLILKKNNLGTAIHGEEKYIRKELMHLLNRLIANADTSFQNTLNINQDSIEFLSQEFDEQSVAKIKRILDCAHKRLGYQIENPYYINLLTHLLILMNRTENPVNASTKVAFNHEVVNQKKYTIAEMIIREMAAEFNLSIDNSEIGYVYAFLISTRRIDDIDFIEPLGNLEIISNSLVNSYVSDLIREMESKLEICFSEDEILVKSLIQHTQPMLNRVKYHVVIVNPLTEDVKKHFTTTFKLLADILASIHENYKIEKLSDDEIAYITLYFQNAIEKSTRIFNILIVCSTGIGSSHFLKTRVENNFPLFNIVDVISSNEIFNYKTSEIDFVLTTVNLPQMSIPHLLIGALLDKADINIIKQFIKSNFGGR